MPHFDLSRLPEFSVSVVVAFLIAMAAGATLLPAYVAFRIDGLGAGVIMKDGEKIWGPGAAATL